MFQGPYNLRPQSALKNQHCSVVSDLPYKNINVYFSYTLMHV